MPAKWCTLTPRVHARALVLQILVLGKQQHFFFCNAPSVPVWVPVQVWVPPCSANVILYLTFYIGIAMIVTHAYVATVGLLQG